MASDTKSTVLRLVQLCEFAWPASRLTDDGYSQAPKHGMIPNVSTFPVVKFVPWCAFNIVARQRSGDVCRDVETKETK